MADRAQTLLADLGYPARDRAVASGFGLSPLDQLLHDAEASSSPTRWDALRRPWPAPVYFWYRTSPRLLVPIGASMRLGAGDPPLAFAGQITVLTDPSGRLAELHVMPPQQDPSSETRPPIDWATPFRLAGLTFADFTEVSPEWVPRMFADERRAWTGRHPDGDVPVRVEAGAYRGRVVQFLLVAPWSRATRQAPAPTSAFDATIATLAGLIMPGLMLASAVLARRNLIAGRVDRRGALQASAAMFVLQVAGWALAATHVTDVDLEVQRTFGAIGTALFSSLVLALSYLALEPFVRRTFPDSLIGWSRVTTGHWRDPRVGRDVLVGLAAGMAMTVCFASHNLLPSLIGQPPPIPIARSLIMIEGLRAAVGTTLFQIAGGLQAAMIGTAGLVALRSR